MAERDYYADLGIAPYSSSTEVKAAFHAAAKMYHPDKTGSADSTAFRQAHEAYEKLTDKEFKADYDRKLRRESTSFEFNNEDLEGTRTAAFEAEEAERKAREAAQPPPRAPSPPPKKPTRKPGESNPAFYLGKAYMAWEKRQAAWEKRHPEYNSYETGAGNGTAHGVAVNMSEHPATTQRCKLGTNEWITPSGQVNVCIFCLRSVSNCVKCPGCEALACRTCLSEVVGRERDAMRYSRSSSYYQSTC
ncbi:hypothetical protein FB567DRAFT_27256 [Paraphoma chrysanthemicola]|uniref:J domain-containing protein n=1 Tax=Paraphoma chrysanthemicola TaxID=798071 RepID=A0A8K0RIB6_9PLEO|nr:hypothetical protein FB567DRAFT_27256 [Paraphoma chrysanthemicola]